MLYRNVQAPFPLFNLVPLGVARLPLRTLGYQRESSTLHLPSFQRQILASPGSVIQKHLDLISLLTDVGLEINGKSFWQMVFGEIVKPQTECKT